MAAARDRRSQNDDSHSLIQAIYGTLESPDSWSEVVPRIARWLGAESALLFTPTEAHLPRGFCIGHNIPDEAWRDYGAHYHACDIWSEEAGKLGLLKPGGALRGEQLLPTKALLGSEIYAGLFHRINIAYLLSGVLTDEEHLKLGPRTHFSLFRGVNKDGFSANEAARYDMLIPHIRRALQGARRIELMHELVGAYQASLSAAGEVILVLGADLSVRHASNEPADIFGPELALQIIRGKLTAAHAETRARLELAARDALAGRPLEPIRAQGPGMSELEITILPLPAARLVARIRRIRRSVSEAVARIAERFRLTRAEQRVLERLGAGSSVSEMGAELSIRPMTVRSHLANLFDKTGARSQRELVALVWQNA